MRLQNLTIIFIIIIIPITLIFSYYLHLQTETIRLQTEYDEKIQEATSEMIQAYEINTTEWDKDLSTLANVKRREILNSINEFTTSLSTKLGVAGSAKENILTYVPAIVYIMYDGYYIYTPTYVPETITDDEGVQLFYYEDAEVIEGTDFRFITNATQPIGEETVSGKPMYVYDIEKGGSPEGEYKGVSFTTNVEYAKRTYKHVLKTFVPYTTTKQINSKYYTINYTLDNYIRIYGDDVQLEGYMYAGSEVSKSGIKNSETGETILPDSYELKEYVAFKNKSEDPEYTYGEYIYIHNSNGEKRYYDSEKDVFFSVSSNGIRNDLKTVRTEDAENTVMSAKVKSTEFPEGNEFDLTEEYYSRDPNAEYTKIVHEWHNTSDGTDDAKDTKGVQYVLLNRVYSDEGTKRNRYRYTLKDNGTYVRMAINTQEEATSSIEVSMNFIKMDRGVNGFLTEMRDFERQFVRQILGKNDYNITTKTELKNIFDEISQEKNECIINSINENLKLSIANYSANSKIDYSLPELSEEDWEQALSNISVITFFQGVKIGLKTYNNYCVVTSTNNNEYASEDDFYYIDTGDKTDGCYHQYGCDHINKDENNIVAYKKLDFLIAENMGDKNYYKHQYNNGTETVAYEPCYYCIINGNKFKKVEDLTFGREQPNKPNFNYISAKYGALIREKYIQMYRTRISEWDTIILVTFDANEGYFESTWDYQPKTYIIGEILGQKYVFPTRKVMYNGHIVSPKWYTEKEGGEEIITGTRVQRNGIETLYARWDE